ncbi:hypothetical protein TRVA0_011S01376 [Trichomonascus vanleenenianus]|uniref:DUF4112 domain-containing protein n=1 Tax=Trichomonascus vanleenenianus TaxID=2268995 RepID=UPI003ECAC967
MVNPFTYLVNKYASKYASGKVQEVLTAEDPYYETIEIDEGGKKSHKHIKRQLPTGLSKNDEKVLKKIRLKAWWLDLCFKMCGCRAGWTAIIGFLPVVGDIINMWFGMNLINACEKIEGGLPGTVRSEMVLNVIIDFAIGFTPIIGSIAGAVYKSNSRNYMILERHLRKKAARHPVPASEGGSTGGVMIGKKVYAPGEVPGKKTATASGSSPNVAGPARPAAAANSAAVAQPPPLPPHLPPRDPSPQQQGTY